MQGAVALDRRDRLVPLDLDARNPHAVRLPSDWSDHLASGTLAHATAGRNPPLRAGQATRGGAQLGSGS